MTVSSFLWTILYFAFWPSIPFCIWGKHIEELSSKSNWILRKSECTISWLHNKGQSISPPVSCHRLLRFHIVVVLRCHIVVVSRFCVNHAKVQVPCCCYVQLPVCCVQVPCHCWAIINLWLLKTYSINMHKSISTIKFSVTDVLIGDHQRLLEITRDY